MTAASTVGSGPLAGRGWLFWLSSTVVLALLALVIWLVFFVSWRTVEIDQGLGERAIRFPYLAAQEFLAERGIETEQVRGLGLLSSRSRGEALGTGDTLLFIDSHRAVSTEVAGDLLDWVAAGGNLILSSRNPFLSDRELLPFDDKDLLFASAGYGVEQSTSSDYLPYSAYQESFDSITPPADSEDSLEETADDEAGPLEELLENMDDDPEAALGSQLTLLRSESCFDAVPSSSLQINALGRVGDQVIEAQFLGNRFLSQLDEAASGVSAVHTVDSRGPQIVSRDFSAGRITLTTDNHLWSNYRIGCYDHAFLLAALTQGSPKVWILLNETSASLPAVLWRAFPVALLLLALALALWIWSQVVRFGPIFESDNRVRRSLLEHIDASAAFLYKKKRKDSLLGELLTEIHQRSERYFFGYSSLPLEQRARLLAEHTQLAPEAIKALLNSQSADQGTLSEAEFVRRVELCQQIRKKL